MNDLVLRPTRVLDADEAHHLGKLLAASGYFQDAKDAAQAAVKVMAGAELGLGPVASMRGVDIIKGEVSLGAGLVAALVRRSPDYDYEVRRWDNEGCTLVFTRHGKPLDPPSTFTHEDAVKARLAGGDNYQKYARNMYFARAMTNGARLHCPDLFAGAVYTPAELEGSAVEGIIDVAPQDAVAPEPAVTPAAPPQPPAPAPTLEERLAPAEPPAPEADPTAVEPEPEPEPVANGTPAEILAQLGMGEATQRFMLVAVGIEDVGDLQSAYSTLTDEQADKLVTMARERAGT